MIKTFRTYSPNHYIMLLFYMALLKWPLMIQYDNFTDFSQDGMLSSFFQQLFAWKGALGKGLIVLITLMILYLQAISLNMIAYDQRMFEKPSHLPGMSYILLSSFFLSWNQLSESLIALTIILRIVAILCKLNNIQEPKKALYNIGIFLGLSMLIYFPSILYLFLLMTAIAVIRPFRSTEWLLMFLGIATPFYFIFCYDYLADSHLLNNTTLMSFRLPFVSVNYFLAALLIVFLLISFRGFLFVNFQMNKLLVNARKSWSIFFIFFLIAGLMPFVDKKNGWNGFLQILPTISLLFSAYFFYSKNTRFSSIVHALIVLAVWSWHIFFPFT